MSTAPSKLRALLMQALRFVGLSGIGWLLRFHGTYPAQHSRFKPCRRQHDKLARRCKLCVCVLYTLRLPGQPPVSRFSGSNCVYITYQIVLIILISLLLAKINALITTYISAALIVRYSAILSKIIVTPITMTLNFFVMRFAIEKL